MNEEQGRAFDAAGAEYLERMEAISDRAAGHAGRGMYFSQLGKPKDAEEAYRTAFKVDPTDIGSRVNLSDLMRQQGPERGGRGAASGCDPDVVLKARRNRRRWRMMRSRGFSSGPSAMRRRWRKCGRR